MKQWGAVEMGVLYVSFSLLVTVFTISALKKMTFIKNEIGVVC